MILATLTTALLLFTIVTCFLHVNAPPATSSHCEKLGFVVLAGGCAAGIWESWRPSAELYAVPLIALGMALVALSMDRDRLRAVLSRTVKTQAYIGPDRRKA